VLFSATPFWVELPGNPENIKGATSIRLRNWSKYNNALKERSKIVFMISRNIEKIWLAA